MCRTTGNFFQGQPRGGKSFFLRKFTVHGRLKKSKILKTSHIFNFLPNRRVYGVRRVDDT